MPAAEPSASSDQPPAATEGKQGVAVASPTSPTRDDDDSAKVKDPIQSVAAEEGDVTRKESNRHVGSTSRLCELLDTPVPETAPSKPQKSKKLGILINEQAADETKRLFKARASFDVEGVEKDTGENKSESHAEQRPGERLRRKTVNRKELGRGSSEGEQSDGPWGAIGPHLSRGKNARHSKGKPERKDTQKRDSPDTTRSSRKRASSYNSLSSRESGQSVRRQTDISQTSSTRYKTTHSRDIPSCLRQTKPRATDPPLSSKYDPSMLPDSKRRGDMDEV